MIIFNTITYISIIVFFTFSIIGHGLIFKKYFTSFKSNFGEIGLYGFLQLYLLVIFIHFFLPINIYVGLFTISVGLAYFLFNFKTIIFNFRKSEFFLILVLFFLLSLSVNLHDDYGLYHLPHVKIVQEFKIIFGLVNLNDSLTLTHGMYDVMSLFKLPYFNNRLIFTVPLIFSFFCIITLIDYFKKRETNEITKIFIFLILILFLIKFNRFKEYGTDIPLILLMFLSQVYFLELSQSFKIHLFIKLVIFSILAFFLKLYAVLIFIYLILFLNKYKKIFDFFRNNLKLFSFLFAIIILTFFKTFITTGCVIYPEPKTCFEKDTIEWSNGKKLTEYRKDFLSAWSKGWKVYLKSTDYNYLISPEEYLNKHKFSYLFFTFQDKDYERILVPIIILLLFIVLNLFNKIKKIENLNNKNKFSLIFFSFLTFGFWLILFPMSKYGGYSYILFFLYIIFYFSFKKLFFLNLNNLKILLFISVVFFIFKNSKRIFNEVSLDEKNKNEIDFINKDFPITNFKTLEYYKVSDKVINYNVSSDLFSCIEIEQICIPNIAKDAVSFKKINDYIHIHADENKILLNNQKTLVYLFTDQQKNRIK